MFSGSVSSTASFSVAPALDFGSACSVDVLLTLPVGLAVPLFWLALGV